MSSLTKNILEQLPDADAYWVAFSGGMDSTVLLNLLATCRESLPGSLGAVHVDHQLQDQSKKWADKCSQVCRSLGVEYVGLTVIVPNGNSASPEAAARTARYQVLENWLPENAVLLTAHHERDQAETLLLQLLRGAGPKGLASMPRMRSFAKGLLARPMLSIAHVDLLEYATVNNLEWIEDPTNEHMTYDRNYLRHTIIPVLKERWPSTDRVIARAASHLSEAVGILGDVAESDYERCQVSGSNELSLKAVNSLSVPRQKNLLRYWIDLGNYLMPSEAVMERILTEVLSSRMDSSPLVTWSDVEIRRYRDDIYLQSQLASFDSSQVFQWQLDKQPTLEMPHGLLEARPTDVGGLSRHIIGNELQIRFRQGGEALKPANRQHTHTLKALFQEWGIPVWLRDRWPLIYFNSQIIAVPGYCVAEGFQAQTEESGIKLDWKLSS